MRFAVTGGRHYQGWNIIAAALDRMDPAATLVHGAATGADSLAAGFWYPGRTEAHPADWALYGKVAGPIRNQEMVDSGLDLLIAFPGNRGTADMVQRCVKAHIPVMHTN